jgi:hypothetical protein
MKKSRPPKEFGNQYAIGGWSDPSKLKGPAEAHPVSEADLAAMSERQLGQLASVTTEVDRERGVLALKHPIKIPPGLLTQVSLQLKATRPFTVNRNAAS